MDIDQVGSNLRVDVSVIVTTVFDTKTEKFLIENEQKKREEVTIKDIKTLRIEDVKEFCFLEYPHILQYFYLLFMSDNTTVTSTIYNANIKPGYTGQVAWMPFYKQITFDNFVERNIYVKKHLTLINPENIDIKKLIGPNLLDASEFETKQTFLIIDNKFMANSDKDEIIEPFQNPVAPYILLNNLVPYSNILNFELLSNNLTDRQMSLEITAKKILFPTFIFTPPILGIIKAMTGLKIKNLYYPGGDVHKKFGFITNNKQNSFHYIMLLERMKSSSKELNITPYKIEENLEMFNTHSKSIINWYINEIKTTFKEYMCSTFLITGTSEKLPNLITFKEFKDILSKESCLKLVSNFYKINAEYTTRFIHLYEIYILKTTGVERVYKTLDEIESANLNNERLHWKKFIHSTNKPMLLNDFRREYSGHTPTPWDTFLTSINAESMPHSIKKENSIYEPNESLEDATIEDNSLIEDMRWIVNRKIEEIIGWINRNFLNVENVSQHFGADTIAMLNQIVSRLQSWKPECLRETDPKIIAMIFIYLLFLDFVIKDSFISIVEKS